MIFLPKSYIIFAVTERYEKSSNRRVLFEFASDGMQVKLNKEKKNLIYFLAKIVSLGEFGFARSEFLATYLPSVSRATRDLPEFILEEKCKNCSRVKKSKKDDFKHKKRYILAQGAHLAIVCPE